MMKSNGQPYYKYVLVYVDDIICVSETPHVLMEQLRAVPYPLKGNDGPPTLYLGTTIGKYHENQYECWTMSATRYLEGALKIVKERIGTTLPKNVDTLMILAYNPELDTSPELNDDQYNFYLNFIGILKWAVELGRVNIAYATATLSCFSANPRAGHMEAVMRVFAYLKRHTKSKLVLDSRPKDWSSKKWIQHDWKDFYPDAVEPVPPDMPPPWGNPRADQHVC